MSQKSSNKKPAHLKTLHKSGAVHHLHAKHEGRRSQWWAIVKYPLFVIASFFASAFIIGVVLQIISVLGISFGRYGTGPVFNTITATSVYLVAFAIIFGAPYVIKRSKISRKTLGLTRLMSWTDIGLAPLGFVAYAILSTIAVAIVAAIFTGFSADQLQDVGFKALTDRTGYILAFTTLIVIAPIAEEMLFRGYLYGKLRGQVPIWVAMIVTSIVFGAVHGQWNVAIDTFVLSMVMCGLREITGSIWAGILLHMIKNTVAFYLLFINPIIPPLG